MNYGLKDSGKREEFSTGSRRDTREGKGRYDLISPYALQRLALILERGAKKYGERNWEKGQPLGRYLDSALRHINCIRMGMHDEDHAAQAMWNLHAFIHTATMIDQDKLPVTLDDIGFVPIDASYENVEEQPSEVPPEEESDEDGEYGVQCEDMECEQPEAGPPTTSEHNTPPRVQDVMDQIRERLSIGPVRGSSAVVYLINQGYSVREIIQAGCRLRLEAVVNNNGLCWRLPE